MATEVLDVSQLPQDIKDVIYEAVAKAENGLSDDLPECGEVLVFGEKSDGTEHIANFTELHEFMTNWVKARSNTEFDKVVSFKGVSGSTQSTLEVGASTGLIDFGLSKKGFVNPPYDATALSNLLELDPVHFRCVKAKVSDTVGRKISLVPAVPVIPVGGDAPEVANSLGSAYYGIGAVSQKKVFTEKKKVQGFIDNISYLGGFRGVLEKAAMELEAVGYCATEVIRNYSGEIIDLAHVPVSRVRVLDNFTGFVEITLGFGGVNFKPVYYQLFGDKWRSKTRVHPVTGEPLPYDPTIDGKLSNGQGWYVDRDTGERTDNPAKAANEILFKVKHHPKTIYYGVPDIAPAVDNVVSNVEIRNYVIQFFQNNAVPRMAIIVKGVRLDPKDVDTIKQYFSAHVKGSAHRTVFIPIPSAKGDISITFEKLDTEYREGSLRETKADNDEAIMTAHGVPPAVLGISVSTNLGDGKAGSQAEIYKDRVVAPAQESWEDTLNKLIKNGLGVTLVKVSLDPLDIKDRKAEMETLKGYGTLGVITLNQIRAIAGLGDPIKGGDRPFVLTPGGIQFVDELLNMESQTTAQQGAVAMSNQPDQPSDGSGQRLGGLQDNNTEQQ